MQPDNEINFQLMKSLTREIFFFINHAKNETGRLFAGLLLKKALYEAKARCLQLNFNIL